MKNKMSVIYSWEYILIVILISTVVTDSQQYTHSWPNIRQRTSPVATSPQLRSPYAGQARNIPRTATGSVLSANRNRQKSYSNRVAPSNSYPRRVYNSNLANRRLISSRNRVTPASSYQIPKPSINRAVNNRNFNRLVPRNNNNFRAVRGQLNQIKSNINRLSNVPSNLAPVNQRQVMNRNQLNGPTSLKPSLRPPDGYKITYCKIFNSTHQLVTFSPISQQTNNKSPQNAFSGRRNGLHVQNHLNIFPHKLQTKYVFVRTEDYVVCSRPFFTPTVPNVHKQFTSTQRPIAKHLPPNIQRDQFNFPNMPKYTPKSVFGRNRGIRRPKIQRPKINPSFSRPLNANRTSHSHLNVHRPLFPKSNVHQAVSKSISNSRLRPSVTASQQTASPFPFNKIKSILSGNIFSTKNSVDISDKMPLERLKSFAVNNVTPVFSDILNRLLKKLENSPLLNPLQIPNPPIPSQKKRPREQSNHSKQTKKSNSLRSNSKNKQTNSTPGARSTTSKSENSRFRSRSTTPKPKTSKPRFRSTTSKPPNSSPISRTTTSKPETTLSKLHLTTSKPLTTSFTRLPKLTTHAPITRRRRPPPVHHRRRGPHRRPHHRRPRPRRPHKHVVKQKIRLYIPPALRKEFNSNKEKRKEVVKQAIGAVREQPAEEHQRTKRSTAIRT